MVSKVFFPSLPPHGSSKERKRKMENGARVEVGEDRTKMKENNVSSCILLNSQIS